MGKKSKYETHVLPNLDRISAWAKQGASQDEIAGKLHIAPSTFKLYLSRGVKGEERFSDLSDLFARACAVADDQVEASLYKRACGYTYTETTVEEKLDRDGVVHELKKTIERDVPPDTNSMMFWLANRRPESWKYKPEGKECGTSEGGVITVPPVVEGKA